MILELDVGNSRLKWRLVDGHGERVAGGATETPVIDGAAPFPWAGRGAPERARVGSVAGARRDAALAARLRDDGIARVDFARSAARHGRLTAGYREPERMGVDRWLALLAAGRHEDGAFVVIDAGSALTVDLVDDRGQHLGGWIVPGLRLMRRALLEGTAGVRFPEAADPDTAEAPGRETTEAVGHGVVLMAADFLVRRVERFRAQHAAAPVYVTGGDGARLAAQLRGPLRCVPDLVLDGLAVALEG